MYGIVRNPIVLLSGWLIVGVVTYGALRSAADRPTNLYAERVTLEPRTGTYGPVNVIVLEGYGSQDWVGVAAVTAASAVWVVSLPGLDLHSESRHGNRPAGTAPGAGVTFDPPELTRRLIPDRAPTPAETEELQELAGVFRAPVTAVRTDIRHFRLVDASPWDRPWWQRRGRPAAGVVLWLLGAAAIWAWALQR